MTQSPFHVWKTHSVAKSSLPKDAPVPPRIVPEAEAFRAVNLYDSVHEGGSGIFASTTAPGRDGVSGGTLDSWVTVVGSPFFPSLHRCSFAGWPNNLLHSLVLNRRVKIEHGVHSSSSSNTLAVLRPGHDPRANTVGHMGHPFCRGTRVICACLY